MRVITSCLRARTPDEDGCKKFTEGDAPNAQAGLDSLAAVDLRDSLGRRFQLAPEDLSATLVFDYPTTAALAAHILSLVPDTNSPVPPTDATAKKPRNGRRSKRRPHGPLTDLSHGVVSSRGGHTAPVVELAAAACIYPGSQRGAP